MIKKDDHDQDRLLMGDAVVSELKQFDKLVALDPPISSVEIAHRMVWGRRSVRWYLNKIGDKRS